MYKASNVAKWFIYKNPYLASGYIDENTKINKLLYFSNLMYYCVNKNNLIDEKFVAFPNGPVVYSVYRDYRYNDLDKMPDKVEDFDKESLKILNIVNFIYGDLPVEALIKESHSHSLWKDVKELIPYNPRIEFEKVEDSLCEYNKQIYNTYVNFNFDNLKKEKINNNIYYYLKDSFDMNDDVIEKLSNFDRFDEPKFLEMIDGELVIS